MHIENKTEKKDNRPDLVSANGKFEFSKLVEAGALLADYASKDDSVSGFWFKPTGKDSCIGIVEFDDNGPRIARNMKILANNEQVTLTLLSSKSERGQEALKVARNLYKK